MRVDHNECNKEIHPILIPIASSPAIPSSSSEVFTMGRHTIPYLIAIPFFGAWIFAVPAAGVCPCPGIMRRGTAIDETLL